MGRVVRNQRPDFEDIQPVIDDQIVETVHGIFESVIELNPLNDLFEDLAIRLIDDLAANSLLEYNLELSDDQKEQLRKVIKLKGNDTVRNYQSNLNADERTKVVYGLVREKTTAIADSLLSNIGKEINRGTIINCRAVQANSKNEKYDEILPAWKFSNPHARKRNRKKARMKRKPGKAVKTPAKRNQKSEGGKNSNEKFGAPRQGQSVSLPPFPTVAGHTATLQMPNKGNGSSERRVALSYILFLKRIVGGNPSRGENRGALNGEQSRSRTNK